MSRYQKSKTNLDFTEARDSEWQWNQLGHMQVCISLHTENHTNTPPLKKVFYRPDALPAAGDTLSEGVQLMELLVEQLDRTASQTTTLGIHQLTEAAALASLTAQLTSVLPRGELC